MTLRASKSQLSGRLLDWCIHHLLEDVLPHYLYQSLRKNWGFVPNKKQERFVVNIVLCARDIPNICMTFLKDDCGYAIWNNKMCITRSTTWNLNGPTMNVSSHKGETYVNIKLNY
jgi:hypothetical protein